jgi:hypothetical protein
MRNTLKAILLSGLLGLSCVTVAGSQADAEKEINYLLDFITASDCNFIRNSDPHSGPDAADHLRGKYKFDKRHVTSAELFISRVATRSSTTGTPYTVKCEDHEAQTTDRWLHHVMAKYRNQLDPYRDR